MPSVSLSPLFSQVVYPPDSPIPLRRTLSVLAPPPDPFLQHHPDTLASSSPLRPSLPTPSCPGPLAGACASSGVQSAGRKPQEEDRHAPPGLTPVPYTVRSVGCQTSEDPLSIPMQAGLPGSQPLPCLYPVSSSHAQRAHPHCVRVAESLVKLTRGFLSLVSRPDVRRPPPRPSPGRLQTPIRSPAPCLLSGSALVPLIFGIASRARSSEPALPM